MLQFFITELILVILIKVFVFSMLDMLWNCDYLQLTSGNIFYTFI